VNAPGGETSEADLDVRRRRALLLVVAAVIAGAGVAYELGLMLLGTVTVGSTERANAVVLGAAMFGMGVGATTGGRLARRPVTAFVGVECLLAVMGAASAPILYWTWASLDAFWGPLLAVAFVLGACIGAEAAAGGLNDRLAGRAATVVAAFTAADYFGALVGAVAFGFVIRPWLGLVDGTIVVAVVNVAMAAAVAVIVPSRRTGMVVVTVAAASVGLILVAASADRVTDNGRQRLYRDPIVARRESAIQEIIVTRRVHPGGVIDTRLFLDGDLQLSSVDSHRYHESLAHPVISLTSARRVLVLGGGDCVAVREVLRHPSVEHVTLVELDPEVTAMAEEVPELRALNEGVLGPAGGGGERRRLHVGAGARPLRRPPLRRGDRRLPRPRHAGARPALLRGAVRPGPPGPGPRRGLGGAVRLTVLRPGGVLDLRGHVGGRRLGAHAVPRRRAELR
jgi:spermidine synthase